MVGKEIMHDLTSDLMGSIGFTMTVTFPMIDEFTSAFKLLGSIAGLILLFISIKYKLILLKEKQEEKKNAGKDK